MKSLREEILAALHSFTHPEPKTVSASSTAPVELITADGTRALKGSELARFIDHTILKADATSAEVQKVCKEALEHRFASVCVNTGRLPEVVKALAGQKDVLPIAVVGFPLGAMESSAKADETLRAVALGAKEIDMVLSIGLLKDGNFEAVETDMAAVVKAAGSVPVKVILENCLLTDEEKIIACVIAKRVGAKFVKTSTGFSTGGATAADISLMRKIVGPEIGVKASGGIRTREDALKMITAGATRVGASASVAIVTATPGSSTGY